MKQRHDDPQFKFRIPIEMKEALEASAKKNGRTLTAEILQRLENSLNASNNIPLSDAAPKLNSEDISEILKIFSRALIRGD